MEKMVLMSSGCSNCFNMEKYISQKTFSVRILIMDLSESLGKDRNVMSHRTLLTCVCPVYYSFLPSVGERGSRSQAGKASLQSLMSKPIYNIHK